MMNLKVVADTSAAALAALAKPVYDPVTITAIEHPDPTDPNRAARRRAHYTAVASHLYMHRVEGRDCMGVVPPQYMAKADDLVAFGRRHPVQNVPVALRSGRELWDMADAATADDLADAAAISIILTLPSLPPHHWESLVTRFVDDNLVSLGMIVDWVIHAKRDEAGTDFTTHPHCHLLATARRWKNDQRRGQRARCWLYSQGQKDALIEAWCRASGLPLPIVKTF